VDLTAMLVPRAFQALYGRTARGYELSGQFNYSSDGFLLAQCAKEGTGIDS
jgi:hypothetical protein